MSTYEPELGQAVFGGPWEDLNMPGFVQRGLETISERIAAWRGVSQTLTDNSGDPELVNEIFAMRSYCWCDEREHPEGCPPNFEHFGSGFRARWYKHGRRGTTVNRSITSDEWETIRSETLAAIPTERCAHDRVMKQHPWAEGNPSFENYWECSLCGAYGFGEDLAYGDIDWRCPHGTSGEEMCEPCYQAWAAD